MNARILLTDEQRKQLEPLLDQIECKFDELSDTMHKLGVPSSAEPFAPCLRCDCDSFVSAPPGRPAGRCARPGCGHPLFSHDVPR
jgi:hypothetical protein